MPIIAPLAEEQLDAESRERIAAGMATGMYTTTFPLRIMARSPAALRSMDEGYKALFHRGLLDDRLAELLRLRSAQLNGCDIAGGDVVVGAARGRATAHARAGPG